VNFNKIAKYQIYLKGGHKEEEELTHLSRSIGKGNPEETQESHRGDTNGYKVTQSGTEETQRATEKIQRATEEPVGSGGTHRNIKENHKRQSAHPDFKW